MEDERPIWFAGVSIQLQCLVKTPAAYPPREVRQPDFNPGIPWILERDFTEL